MLSMIMMSTCTVPEDEYIHIRQSTSSYITTIMGKIKSAKPVSNQQGILGHLSDFDETWCVCSTYGAHHSYQLLTTYIT